MFNVNGFYGHVRRNDFRSIAMFLGFLFACQLIGIAIMVGPLLLIDTDFEPVSNFPGYLKKYGGWVFVFSFCLFFVRFLLHVGHIRSQVMFKPVGEAEEPRLYKIVELQAIAAGIKVPGVGVIEDEARNAFACGMSQRSAVVVVTRGLLRALDDEELEAVVAHEISHIVNGDIRLMAVANVMLSTLFWLKNNNPIRIEDYRQIILIVVMPPFLILFLVAGFITSIAMTLGKLSRLLIASSREYIADAEAVRMTKNPSALISALKKIEGRSVIADLDDTVDAMMIDGLVEGAYASHPTIEERVKVLARHAGAMAFGAGVRKDTRKITDFAPSPNGGFGRKSKEHLAVNQSSKRLLVDRVNAGSNENAFGLSPKMRNLVLLAIIVPVGLKTCSMNAVYSDLMDFEKVRNDLTKPLKQGGFTTLNDHFADETKPLTQYQLARKLGKKDPMESLCFATEGYSVGDRGLHSVREPDRTLVRDYVHTGKLPSDVAIEKYAAIRLLSIAAVRNALSEEERDEALISYVKQRKSMLMIMHRFFGDGGLAWMQEAYNSNSDREMLTLLKGRNLIKSETKKNQKLAKEIDLLLRGSSSFIPCYVRAGLNMQAQQPENG